MAQLCGVVGVDALETQTQSFIIKIWVEDEEADEDGGARWRGQITHVPSGKRSYLRDLDCIEVFMTPYLERMGVKFGVGWRIRRWLKL